MAELKEGDISAQLNDQEVLDKKIETLVLLCGLAHVGNNKDGF